MEKPPSTLPQVPPGASLPAIPAKRYFTIGEVSELCGVKPYVLRYWEQEFTQLKPMKRRGNRRYYQHHEVLLIRRIRDLLYDQGFTISGARNRLGDLLPPGRAGSLPAAAATARAGEAETAATVTEGGSGQAGAQAGDQAGDQAGGPGLGPAWLRAELLSIRDLLTA